MSEDNHTTTQKPQTEREEKVGSPMNKDSITIQPENDEKIATFYVSEASTPTMKEKLPHRTRGSPRTNGCKLMRLIKYWDFTTDLIGCFMFDINAQVSLTSIEHNTIKNRHLILDSAL